jgi:hypothetical protein
MLQKLDVLANSLSAKHALFGHLDPNLEQPFLMFLHLEEVVLVRARLQ